GAKGAVEIIFRADIGDAEKIAARTREYEDRFLSPFIAAERGYIDDVIMPHSTRKRIARALAMLKDKKVETPAKKQDNLPLRGWQVAFGDKAIRRLSNAARTRIVAAPKFRIWRTARQPKIGDREVIS